MNPYLVMKKKHQDEHNDFPLFFAFSDQRFLVGLQKLGLSKDDVDQVVSIGAGGYCRKDDVERLRNMGIRHKAEMTEALKDEAFLEDALTYELANYEYGYTHDATDALETLGFTEEQVNSDPKLKRILRKAKRNQGDPF